MSRIGFVVVAAMAVAGCNNDTVSVANDVDNGAVENAADALNYQAEVIKLPVAAQEGVFLRAVRDAGLTCQKVTKSERLEDRAGNPTWRATCDSDSPHLISITRDGTANVVSRTDAR